MALDAADISSGAIEEKAEQVARLRFRDPNWDDPYINALLEIGKYYISKDLIRNPHKMEEPLVAKSRKQPEPGETPSLPGGRLHLLNRRIKLPALPQVFFQLQEVMHDPNASAEDLAEIIGLEPKLTAALLRLVNSALFGFPSEIDTLSRAVAILGMRKVSVLALGTLMMNLFKQPQPQGFPIETFWKHSFACGAAARMLAVKRGGPDPERCFIAGLLHDIGRPAIFTTFPDVAEVILSVETEYDVTLLEAEQTVLQTDHAAFGAELLRDWKFPPVLTAVAEFHHTPDKAPEYEEPSLIHAADCIAKAMGMHLNVEHYIPELNEHAWKMLNIQPEDLVEGTLQLDDHLEEVFSVLDST